MKDNAFHVALVVCMGTMLGAVPAVAGTSSSNGKPAPSTEDVAAKKALRGPKLFDLRYNEDFSYLDGDTDSFAADVFNPIKYIHLNEDWTLTLGGEFRFRLEAETNKAFGATEPAQDTFALYRYLVHADMRHRDGLRIFTQGVSVFDEERDLALRGIDENRWDLHQLFVDVPLHAGDQLLTLRVGRQELLFGNQRYVSPFNWGNIRRRFDGVSLLYRGEQWNVDLWYVKPIPVQRKQRDRFDEDFDFYGAYATYDGIPRHGLDLYFFAIENRAALVNPNGRAGDRSIFTLGSRFWGKTGQYDYEAELAGQWGRWAGDDVQAWSWTLEGGYTFADRAWQPRLGAGFDWASGDDNPFDGSVQTFDQLFPLGHKYFGYMDLIGRQNIMAANVNVTAWPVPKKVKTRATFHSFWLESKEDAVYNAGARAGRRDLLGRSGRNIGQELDLTVAWKLNVHNSFLLGYSHFWDGDVITRTGVSEDADFAYFQYTMKF